MYEKQRWESGQLQTIIQFCPIFHILKLETHNIDDIFKCVNFKDFLIPDKWPTLGDPDKLHNKECHPDDAPTFLVVISSPLHPSLSHPPRHSHPHEHVASSCKAHGHPLPSWSAPLLQPRILRNKNIITALSAVHKSKCPTEFFRV